MDYNLDIKVNGKAAGDQIRTVIRDLNETQRAAERSRVAQQRMVGVRKELAAFAKKDREEAFQRLTVEERLNSLMQRREKLARMIAQAENNPQRLAVLKLQSARNEGRIKEQERAQASAASQRAAAEAASKNDALMMLPGAALIGGLSAKFKGFAALKKMFSGVTLGNALPPVAGGIAGLGLAGNLSSGMNASDELSDLADRLDQSTTSLQRLMFSAQSTGGDFGGFVRSIEALKKAQSEALQGNKEYLDDFARLGITFKQLSAESPQDLWYEVAQGIKDGSVNASNFNSMLKILGRESKEILPALKQGVKDASEEFDNLGLAISSGTISGLNRVKEVLTNFGAIAAAAVKKVSVETAGGTLNLLRLLSGGAAVFGGTLFASDRLKNTGTDLLASSYSKTSMGSEAEDNAKLLELRRAEQIAAGERKKAADEAAAKEKEKEAREKQAQIAKAEAAKTEEMAKRNKQEINDLLLEEMTKQEKINYLTAQKADLEKRIRSEKNALTREELVAEHLRATKELGQTAKNVRKPEVDNLRRLGLRTAGGVNLEMRTIVNEIKGLRQDVNKLKDAAKQGFGL